MQQALFYLPIVASGNLPLLCQVQAGMCHGVWYPQLGQWAK